MLVATPGALAEVLSPPQPQPVLDAARFLVIDEVDACLAVSTLRRHLILAYHTVFCLSGSVPCIARFDMVRARKHLCYMAEFRRGLSLAVLLGDHEYLQPSVHRESNYEGLNVHCFAFRICGCSRPLYKQNKPSFCR